MMLKLEISFKPRQICQELCKQHTVSVNRFYRQRWSVERGIALIHDMRTSKFNKLPQVIHLCSSSLLEARSHISRNCQSRQYLWFWCTDLYTLKKKKNLKWLDKLAVFLHHPSYCTSGVRLAAASEQTTLRWPWLSEAPVILNNTDETKVRCRECGVTYFTFRLLGNYLNWPLFWYKKNPFIQSKVHLWLSSLPTWWFFLDLLERTTHTGDAKLWRPAMNLAAFADSEEDISIQLPLARLQLLRMPSLVSC